VFVHVVEVQRHPFLTSTLDGREWFISRPGYVPLLRKKNPVPIECKESRFVHFGKEKFLKVPTSEPQDVHSVTKSLYVLRYQSLKDRYVGWYVDGWVDGM
jgi:hypothetical protein